MHELGLMESLVEAVEAQLPPGERARVVRLEVGALAAVVPEALRFCFDVCAAGTRIEGAVLEVRPVEGAGLRLVEVEVG
jgi:hydrogenase nickel incorporation protein HypA/HybF